MAEASAAPAIEPAAVSPAAPAAPAATGFEWLGESPSADLTNVVTAKGWKSGADVVTSYRNLETIVGAPPDKIVKLPTDGKPESWNAVWDKLGRPASADAYKIPIPDGVDPAFAKTTATWFHEAGLNQTQAEKIAGKWNEFIGGANKQGEAAKAEASQAQVAALKLEWGAALEQNTKVAQAGARALGLDAEMIDRMQDAMGYDKVMKAMHNVGVKLSEDSFVSGKASSGMNANVMTPEQAQAEINALRNDPQWIHSWAQGDVEKQNRLKQLNAWLHPGG